MKGIPQAERARRARDFLANVSDDELVETTPWKIIYCWQLGTHETAERLLLAEKLKRSLITVQDLRPDQRRAMVDPANVDLHAIAAGPIMDAAQLYLPAGKISMAEARERERGAVQKL